MKIHAHVFDINPATATRAEAHIGRVLRRIVKSEGHKAALPAAVYHVSHAEGNARHKREMKVRRLYGEGRTYRDIGRALGGITAGAAHRYVERLIEAGLMDRRREGMRPQSNRRIDWDEVVALKKTGLTNKTIAERVGCGSSYISAILKAYPQWEAAARAPVDAAARSDGTGE